MVKKVFRWGNIMSETKFWYGLVIQHDCESKLYSIDFSEFSDFFVVLLSIFPSEFLCKISNKNLLMTKKITFGGEMV